MKRLLFCFVTLMAVLMVEFPASASVTTEIESGMNYTINRPVVHTGNTQTDASIEADIERYIRQFQKDFSVGEFINGKIEYQVMYEDTQSLSILLSDYRFAGGIHGNRTYYGLNYDKSTGKRLLLPYFVRLRPDDKRWIYELPVYDAKNQKLSEKDLWDEYYQKPISDNYYMLGNGELALIYQPYELTAYVYGVTHIKLTREWIDFFNRKNR